MCKLKYQTCVQEESLVTKQKWGDQCDGGSKFGKMKSNVFTPWAERVGSSSVLLPVAIQSSSQFFLIFSIAGLCILDLDIGMRVGTKLHY